jgi:aspartate/methionine/tyrosine aminotransferase
MTMEGMWKVAKRAEKIPPFIVMDILEKAHDMEKQGRNIIHLEIGEPDFPELREAICDHYGSRYGVRITPDRIIVTSGTSPALFMLFSALLERGDEIILSDPHYPCYPNFANWLEASPIFVDVSESDGFQLHAQDVKKKLGQRTRAVLINSPSNPTGNLLPPSRMAELAELGIPIISDEIYHGLAYGEKEHSILEFTDNAFVLNGFSKLYAMTGWRLGYIIAPKPFIRPLQKVQQNFFISAGSVSQWAGVTALTRAHDDVAQMRLVYDERRRFMIRRVKELGFGLPVEPSGAFYMLVNAKHLNHNSYELAFDILEQAGVGVSPGIDFGRNAEGYLRLSYANSIENIKEGLDRIEAFIQKNK